MVRLVYIILLVFCGSIRPLIHLDQEIRYEFDEALSHDHVEATPTHIGISPKLCQSGFDAEIPTFRKVDAETEPFEVLASEKDDNWTPQPAVLKPDIITTLSKCL